MNANVLIVDDQDDIRELCVQTLLDRGFRTLEAPRADAALALLEGGEVDIVLTDLNMPGMSGLELLREVKRRFPEVDVVMMTGFATIPTAVEATRLGAYDYITKPFEIDDLGALLERLMERRELASENRVLREQLSMHQGFGEMIGTSPAMQQLYRLLVKMAPKRHPILVTGESGTGKELIARAVHRIGTAEGAPFVPVDCGALSATLIESELFGHVRGAFTGATQDREGLLASARRGTVFLDEIGELPIELQAKLLRALQEREFRPVGGNRRVQLEARIVAATNRNLEEEIRKEKFREDLYFRLNVLTVVVPPLRERKADIPILVQHFIQRDGGDDGVEGISSEAMGCLLEYNWPGNVRELENYIRRAVALASGPVIDAGDLPAQVRAVAGGTAESQELSHMEELERRAIIQTLEATGGDRVRAARLLGIGKTTIYRKLKQYGLQDAASNSQ